MSVFSAEEADKYAMRRAIALAARAVGDTSPNPVVGCVVLDPDGRRAGEGFHAFAGGPHAEIAALREAGRRARGGTLVVTLEPCDRQGRTAPCTRAIIDAGIRRVIYAVADPGPAGGGARRLAAAGLQVTGGVLAGEAERGNAEWLTFARLGRPHITWKFAATLDGRSAAADRTSQWITGPEARRDVHRLRARCDALIAGSGTVLADDPRLTVRGFDPHDHLRTHRRPLRVIADGRARTPPHSRVLDSGAPTLIAVAEDADAGALEGGAAVVRLPRAGRGLDLTALLAELRDRQIVSALLEGGPTLAGSFVAAGLVDRVVAYLAPALLGAGTAALGDAGVATLVQAHRLEIDEITPMGPDLRITARVSGRASEVGGVAERAGRVASEDANVAGRPARVSGRASDVGGVAERAGRVASEDANVAGGPATVSEEAKTAGRPAAPNPRPAPLREEN